MTIRLTEEKVRQIIILANDIDRITAKYFWLGMFTGSIIGIIIGTTITSILISIS